jgi:hypothetical protein
MEMPGDWRFQKERGVVIGKRGNGGVNLGEEE